MTDVADKTVAIPDADAIAAAALQSPKVAAMAGGGLAGEAATYLPGRRVIGVRIDDDHVEVHVVARWDAVLPDLADGVRQAVAPVADGRSVSVHIDDIEIPDEP